MTLDVRKLYTFLNSEKGTEELLHEITFSISEGEIVAIIGESGSGKSILTRSLTRLFSDTEVLTTAGSVRFSGIDLAMIDDDELARLRQTSIRYVFQDPAQALNPALTIRRHVKLLVGSAEEEFSELLADFGIRNVESVLASYPHELSVGMAQRVLVAMAMAGSPALIIADEPTSSIDTILRRQLLEVLSDRCKSKKLSLLMTTHDLGVAEAFADRVLVLYDGRIVESGPAAAFFRGALHPYSQFLLANRPGLLASPQEIAPSGAERSLKVAIDGGCRFHPRCPRVKEDCRAQEPALTILENERSVRCPYWM